MKFTLTDTQRKWVYVGLVLLNCAIGVAAQKNLFPPTWAPVVHVCSILVASLMHAWQGAPSLTPEMLQKVVMETVKSALPGTQLPLPLPPSPPIAGMLPQGSDTTSSRSVK